MAIFSLTLDLELINWLPFKKKSSSFTKGFPFHFVKEEFVFFFFIDKIYLWNVEINFTFTTTKVWYEEKYFRGSKLWDFLGDTSETSWLWLSSSFCWHFLFPIFNYGVIDWSFIKRLFKSVKVSYIFVFVSKKKETNKIR